MRNELREQKLEVVLVPAPDPKHHCHYIRVVENRPPVWFSEFAHHYMRSSKRAPRPRPNFIKRRETMRALESIAAGKTDTIYAQRWLREIRRILANEQEQVPF